MSDRDNDRKHFVGTVVSDRMDKTITVEVSRITEHDRYGKYLERSTRLKAHDEDEEAGEGDRVEIAETRPLSRTKRFRLVDVLEEAPSAGT